MTIWRRKHVAKLSQRGLTRRKLRIVLSRIIILRDGQKCRACGHRKRPGPLGALQAAHILSVGAYPRLEFELGNVICLCGYCHLGTDGWHENPDRWSRWVRGELGDEHVDGLYRLAQFRARGPKADLAAIEVYLRIKLKHLENDRRDDEC